MQKSKRLQIHVLTLAVAIFIGLIGGLLGAFFVRFNLVVNRFRNKLLSHVSNVTVKRVLLIVEMLIIVVSWLLFYVHEHRRAQNKCASVQTSMELALTKGVSTARRPELAAFRLLFGTTIVKKA